MGTRIIAAILTASVMLSAAPLSANAADESLSDLVESFLVENRLGPEKIGISYYNTVTGESYVYNDQKMMIAASTYKLPLNLYYYEQVAQGNISPNSRYAGYKLSDCHRLSLQYSDNPTSIAMRQAIGSHAKFKEAIVKYTGVDPNVVGAPYTSGNYFNVYSIMNSLKYLYANSVFFEEALGYLHAATPGQYFERYVKEYNIAQKYGYLNNVIHTAGIVYTDTPYLLCVFTQNVGYAENTIGKLNRLFCDYTVSKNQETQTPFLFYDTDASDWFYPQLKYAVENGMISGVGQGKFAPDQKANLYETIKLACDIYLKLRDLKHSFKPQSGEPWYAPYVDFALDKRLILPDEFGSLGRKAKRIEAAAIFARAIGVESIDYFDVSVPDVKFSDKYG
ncbi:serine hydrolase, partial [Clostridiaceae bacterium OttesenSCG-928-D20]|nr:serine hydrolase [Clostridiaceae bacterium OttesenSCG-928-D20]